MKTDNYQELQDIIKTLKQFRDDIYDYDYDRETLWEIDEAINHLNSI